MSNRRTCSIIILANEHFLLQKSTAELIYQVPVPSFKLHTQKLYYFESLHISPLRTLMSSGGEGAIIPVVVICVVIAIVVYCLRVHRARLARKMASLRRTMFLSLETTRQRERENGRVRESRRRNGSEFVEPPPQYSADNGIPGILAVPPPTYTPYAAHRGMV